MGNNIFVISSEEYLRNTVITELSNCFVVNLEGKKIVNKNNLFSVLKKEYDLPDVNGWDSLVDWLTDLSWIDVSNFCLNIHNYSDFLKEEQATKDIFLEVFKEDILPFWEKEVLTTVVNGRIKGFFVYLLD